MEEKVSLELTLKEARLFKSFRKYQDIWEEAERIKPGSIVIHFNKDNQIKKYEFHIYKHGNLTDNLAGGKIK